MPEPRPLQSLRALGDIDDPRRIHPTTLHSLMDIIAMTLPGTLCGAESWVEIEQRSKSKASWLETVLPLEHGIPSHDTISRVLSMLDPDQVVEASTRWTSLLAGHVEGVVALDGKTVRRSMSTADGRGPVHMKLDVYQAAIDLAVMADSIVERLPRGRAYLADQLQRAATSVPLNVAEGAGELSRQDKARLYRMARRCATECAAVLDVCSRLSLVQKTSHWAGRELLLRVVSMLTKMTRSLAQNT